jgi:hypothetical protein
LNGWYDATTSVLRMAAPKVTEARDSGADTRKDGRRPGGWMSSDPRVLLVDDEPRLRAQLGAVLADYVS